MNQKFTAEEVQHIRQRLKSGEYDGTVIMRAWIALEAYADSIERAQPADSGRVGDEAPIVQQLRGRAAFLRDKGRIKSPEIMERAADTLEAALAAQGQLPASPAGVPEEWITSPDSIPQPIIQACRDAICREFGNNGTDGYYKRILAAIFKAIAAAPSAPEGADHG
jgi:hypothetical protein